MREAVSAFFAQLEAPAEWEVRVQWCTDIGIMPIEDASVPWPEDVSPYVTVARVSVAGQLALSPERVKAADDATSFSPWHGVAWYRPLGSLMRVLRVLRVRKGVYAASANFRAPRNGCPIHESFGVDMVDWLGGFDALAGSDRP